MQRMKFLALVVLCVALAATASSATFRVTSDAAAGSGSLASAIEAANHNPGADVIEFALPGSGLHTIDLGARTLPALTGPVTFAGAIDANGRTNIHIATSRRDAAALQVLSAITSSTPAVRPLGAAQSDALHAAPAVPFLNGTPVPATSTRTLTVIAIALAAAAIFALRR